MAENPLYSIVFVTFAFNLRAVLRMLINRLCIIAIIYFKTRLHFIIVDTIKGVEELI